jgi:hypothetical protein
LQLPILPFAGYGDEAADQFIGVPAAASFPYVAQIGYSSNSKIIRLIYLHVPGHKKEHRFYLSYKNFLK